MSKFTDSALFKKVVPKKTQETIRNVQEAAKRNRRREEQTGNAVVQKTKTRTPPTYTGGNVGDPLGIANQFNRPQPPPKTVSPIVAKITTIRDIIRPNATQMKSIDPSASYRLEDNSIVSGGQLQKIIAKNMITDVQSVTRMPNTGTYLKKDGMYYNLSPSASYLYTKSSDWGKKNILGSLGPTPTGFIGPVYDPFPSAYERLSPENKETFGYHFTDWQSVEPSMIRDYPGGQRYLSSLRPDERSSIIDKVLKYNKSFPQGGIGSISAVELSRRAGLYVNEHYHEYNTADLFEKARREVTWQALTEDPIAFREKTFMSYPWYQRVQIAGISAAGDVSFGMASLPQTGYKLVTGNTVGPDIMKTWEEARPGAPYDLITTGISEGTAYFTNTDSRAWERFQADPLSGLTATGTSLLTMWGAGRGFHVAKVGTIRGLGKVRSYGLEHGVTLPSYAQISYNYPQRIIRRAWVQYGTKNIDDIMGTPYHNVDTLVHKGLSFAPGDTSMQRVNWTIQRSLESRNLPLSGDDFLLGSASGQRIGGRFVIKTQALHELPALSATPYGFSPTRFYRFTGSNLSYSSSFSLLPKVHLPSGFAIRLKNVFIPPRGSYDDIARWAAEQPKGSWGTIGPKMYLGGPEIELNIFGRTTLKRFIPDGSSMLQKLRGYKYFTDVPLQETGYFSGKPLIEKVPVVFTSPIHTGFPTGVSSILGRAKNTFDDMFTVSDYSIPTSSAINPISLSAMYSKALSTTKTYSSPSSSKTSSSSAPSYSKGTSISYSKISSSSAGSKSYTSSISKSISKATSSQTYYSHNIISSAAYGYSRPSVFKTKYSIVSPLYYKYGSNKQKRGIVIHPVVVDPRYLYREFKLPSIKEVLAKVKI